MGWLNINESIPRREREPCISLKYYLQVRIMFKVRIASVREELYKNTSVMEHRLCGTNVMNGKTWSDRRQ